MRHLPTFALAVALALLTSACAKKNGTLMVDHPMYEYQPPAVAEADDDADADDDSGSDDATAPDDSDDADDE